MNTYKQVNVMIGLLLVFAVATLLYFLWDSERATEATDRQLTRNAEFGGALYALNCRACHGLVGKGALESSVLPGLPLNSDLPYRDQGAALAGNQQRYRDTIRCGRVGTVMPSWHQDYGGPLNDFQIQQLVTLITSTASAEGWNEAIKEANFGNGRTTHGDEFVPAKHLTAAVTADEPTLALDDARGLRAGGLLRLDEKPDDEVYEVVTIVDAPAGSILTKEAARDSTELTLQEAAVFHPGDKITVGTETMLVMDAPASTALVNAISTTDTKLTVTDPKGLAPGDIIKIHGEKLKVTSVLGDSVNVLRAQEDTQAAEHVKDALVTEQGSVIQVQRGQDGTTAQKHDVKTSVFEIGNSIIVERAAFGTKAAEHPANTEVFNGPIIPGNTVTGATGAVPCGQKAPAATPAGTPAPAETVDVTGTTDMTMGDNFFDLGGKRNPTLKIAAGATVTVNLKNNGAAVHNLMTTGPDGTFGTGDDVVSNPVAVPGGATGTLQITFPAAGSYKYQCQFHPADMKGDVTVQ
ncbi:MAG TPA: cupredoxin domain-containing protein [Dehalococcoidia bacterium]|nr:cupredoxin domain-containing protein [Dehalococcoidia bacterium]